MPRRKKPTWASMLNDMRNEFRMSRETRFQSRLTGVSSTGSGADYHYASERHFLHMIERARHYQRNDPIIGQGIRRLVANVIQDGFTLDVSTNDKGLDHELKTRWDEWSREPVDCHSEAELNWCQMERLALSQCLVDGDVFALPLKTGQLQWVEAHRVRTPSNTTRNVVHGVLLDSRAKRREYWITREDLDPYKSLQLVSDIKPYAAYDSEGKRQVLHLYDAARFSQRRGITALAPISETTGMHDDIQFATLVKAQMAALIAIFHERSENWQPVGTHQKGEITEEVAGGYTRTIEGISAGLEVFGDPGEKLAAFSANVPSPEFVPHAMLILTFIAINLDLPVAVLLLDPSKTNFSGWRGAIDQARIRFRQMQRWLISKLHGPVYEWKVRQWMATDPALRSMIAKSGISPFAHQWHPPTWDYIEPLKDASADLLQQRNAINSPRRIQARRGREWEVIIEETIQDNRMAITRALEVAQEINAEFPDAGIHWRELISLPTPDGVSIALASTQEGVTDAAA